MFSNHREIILYSQIFFRGDEKIKVYFEKHAGKWEWYYYCDGIKSGLCNIFKTQREAKRSVKEFLTEVKPLNALR